MIGARQITALVLAGGRGSRMGGRDKGLQPYAGQVLAAHALARLRAQAGPHIACVAINANRHLDDYRSLGAPVWPDALAEHPGPLAGFLAGLTHAATPYVLTVPCDAPRFPLDLAQRLAAAFDDPATRIAIASAPDATGTLRPQPVFCLLGPGLRDDLADHLRSGGRKVGHWCALHGAVQVPFGRADDDPQAFANANTLDELQALERSGAG